MHSGYIREQFFNGPFGPLFLYFCHFITVFIQLMKTKFAGDWIWTMDLEWRKQPLYQLIHNHCPRAIFLNQEIDLALITTYLWLFTFLSTKALSGKACISFHLMKCYLAILTAALSSKLLQHFNGSILFGILGSILYNYFCHNWTAIK